MKRVDTEHKSSKLDRLPTRVRTISQHFARRRDVRLTKHTLSELRNQLARRAFLVGNPPQQLQSNLP